MPDVSVTGRAVTVKGTYVTEVMTLSYSLWGH